MAKQAVQHSVTEQNLDFEQKIQKLREIYADANNISKAALENVIRNLQSAESQTASATKMESAGRIGVREGKVSELTAILSLKPGGAKRMRAFLELAWRPRQSKRGLGWHCSRHALGLSGQRHEGAVRQHLRRRLGSLHR